MIYVWVTEICNKRSTSSLFKEYGQFITNLFFEIQIMGNSDFIIFWNTVPSLTWVCKLCGMLFSFLEQESQSVCHPNNLSDILK